MNTQQIFVSFEKISETVNQEVFREYQTDDDEFYDVPGKQHYKLLSYLSTFFKDSDLIDIGTHKGSSALALSYEPSNFVHTFDIVDKVAGLNTPKKKFSNKPNIVRHYRNLWENLSLNKDFLFSSPMIFVDIDPHEGRDELIFYYFMLLNRYPGILIFDDIHYFEGMRKFWAQVDDKYKTDLTKYGHFSGTGVVIFNPEIRFILESSIE